MTPVVRSRLLALLLFVIFIGAGCENSANRDAPVTAAEEKLRTLKSEAGQEAMKAEAEELHRQQEELMAQKIALWRELEEKLESDGWRTFLRNEDGSPLSFFLVESVQTVGPGLVWLQTSTLPSEDRTEWVFTGVMFHPEEKTWAPADKPGRSVDSKSFIAIEGELDPRAESELLKAAGR